MCLFRIGDVGGSSKHDEKNQTLYILKELENLSKKEVQDFRF